MATDEQEPQNVVAVVGIVEALGERRFGILKVRKDLVGGQCDLLAPSPHRIDGGIAGNHDEPGCRIARRTVLGPGLERPLASLLKGVFGGVEVAKIAHQRRHRLRPRGGQRRVDPRKVGHVRTTPGSK